MKYYFLAKIYRFSLDLFPLIKTAEFNPRKLWLLLVDWSLAIDYNEQTFTQKIYEAIWCFFEELSEITRRQLKQLSLHTLLFIASLSIVLEQSGMF